MTRKKREFNIFEKDQLKESKNKADIDYIEASSTSKAPKETNYVRHTFIIDPDDLKLLQDIVHKVKSTGNYQFTQKIALKEAIDLLNQKYRQSI